MNASSNTAQSTASVFRKAAAEVMGEAVSPLADDDLAIGCECADPALQIELWGHEVFAPPLQRLS